jgi:DNA-binding phage protein
VSTKKIDNLDNIQEEIDAINIDELEENLKGVMDDFVGSKEREMQTIMASSRDGGPESLSDAVAILAQDAKLTPRQIAQRTGISRKKIAAALEGEGNLAGEDFVKVIDLIEETRSRNALRKPPKPKVTKSKVRF